jgi:hypothetical protein
MTTSRFMPDIVSEFKMALRLEMRASDDDVTRFIAGQIIRLPKCIQRDTTLQDLVQSRIVETVDDM